MKVMTKVEQLWAEMIERRQLLPLVPDEPLALPSCTDAGEPLVYQDLEGCELCCDCATTAFLSDEEAYQFRPVEYRSHLEGPPIECDECHTEIVSLYSDSDEQPAEPGEDDYTTLDYVVWYQHDKAVVHVDEANGQSWQEALREHMDREQFWPSCWFCSDHGNWQQLHLTE